MEPRCSNSAFRVLTSALVTVMLVCSAGSVEAYVTDADYQECQKACDLRFRPILPTETNCDKALQEIRSDLIVIRNYLRTKKVCRGRHRKKCDAFKKKVILSLGILTPLLGNARGCKSLDVTTARNYLWALDFSHACRGDNDYTDLHDLMAQRGKLLRLVSAKGTNYQLTRERISKHPEYKSAWPQCQGRFRPARFYVWPLFEFLQAVESVGEVQTCLAACRPPTPQERSLEKLLGQVDQLAAVVSTLARELGQMTEERADRLQADFGTIFSCSRLTDSRLAVETAVKDLDALLKDVYALTTQDPPSQSRVTEAVQRAALLKDRLQDIRPNAARDVCIAQEKLARKLVDEKRRVQRTVTQKGSISPSVARRFDDLGKAGDDCDWTTGCCVPLVCEDGHCEGEPSLPEVLPLLAEVERVGRSVGEIAVFTPTGFDRQVEADLRDLSKELNKLQSRLAALGWSSAVQAWGAAYAEDLFQQIKVVEAQAESVLAEAVASRPARTVPGGACAEAISALKGITEDIRRVRDRVGDGDPILDPTWVRLRTDEVRALNTRVDELNQLLTQDCRAAARSTGSAQTPIWLVVGVSLLLALLGLGLWLVLRSRRRRSSPNDEGE